MGKTHVGVRLCLPPGAVSEAPSRLHSCRRGNVWRWIGGRETQVLLLAVPVQSTALTEGAVRTEQSRAVPPSPAHDPDDIPVKQTRGWMGVSYIALQQLQPVG